ncbi:MAG: hypothetical protein ACI9CZ_001674, partial [Flavobacterium sp.]
APKLQPLSLIILVLLHSFRNSNTEQAKRSRNGVRYLF